MMQLSSFAKLACAVVVIATAACSKWPPLNEELSKHFANRRSAFQELREQFEASGLAAISFGAAASDIMASEHPDKYQQPMSGEEASVLRQKLYQANIFNVYRVEDRIYFQPYFPNEHGGMLYEAMYVFNPGSVAAKSCDEVDKEQSANCHIRLEDDWIILYAWGP